jgi:HD-GYP domain-containing protein (c-di-GMP phosphodiesterase class II)
MKENNESLVDVKKLQSTIIQLESLLKINTRAFNLITKINMALVKSVSKEQLISEYCKIIVNDGGYTMVWIGIADKETKKLIKVISKYAYNGSKITSDDIEFNIESYTKAINTNQPVIINDISNDPLIMNQKTNTLNSTYNSAITIPFKFQNTNNIGLLNIYSREISVWSKFELDILTEIVNGLIFGLMAIDDSTIKVQTQIELQESLEQTIQILGDVVESRDSYTAGHQRRVSAICTKIATKLELSEHQIHGIYLTASIHDLGKIGIPAEILSTPRTLTNIERTLVNNHSLIGFNLIKNIKFPWPVARIIIEHHERINGSGYPYGLTGDQLLIESKILAVADSFESMISHRPYRASLGATVAIAELKLSRGVTLDAEIVDICIQLFEELGDNICN